MFRIYLWIDGEGFDPVAFDEKHGRLAGGSVGERKRLVGKRGEISPAYWRSEEIGDLTTHTLDDAVRSLLSRLRPVIREARQANGKRVMLEVVEMFREEDPGSVEGLFLSVESLAMLAEFGASLDVDIVCDLS